MHGSELNSTMLFIHPPLAIAGYVFIFLFALSLFFFRRIEKKRIRLLGIAAWLLTFLGLVTGMLWAQMAWGSYWSWDPKETLTLLLFVAVSASLMVYNEKKFKLAKTLSLLSCILSIVTASSSLIIAGLHSFI
jgi:ABC-type transport system involved in cytochrome c biogenesis permease subunit